MRHDEEPVERRKGWDTVLIELEYTRRDVDEIKKKLEGSYVTQTEFEPIKKLVFGLVSVILIAVVGALMTLVLKS